VDYQCRGWSGGDPLQPLRPTLLRQPLQHGGEHRVGVVAVRPQLEEVVATRASAGSDGSAASRAGRWLRAQSTTCCVSVSSGEQVA
jgi:hypothetical protein